MCRRRKSLPAILTSQTRPAAFWRPNRSSTAHVSRAAGWSVMVMPHSYQQSWTAAAAAFEERTAAAPGSQQDPLARWHLSAVHPARQGPQPPELPHRLVELLDAAVEPVGQDPGRRPREAL